MTINKNLHISFDFENANGNKASLFIDFIDKRRFDIVSASLGKVYSVIKSGEYHPDVFVVDWKQILENDVSTLEAFLESLLTTAELISEEQLVKFANSKKKLESELSKAAIDEDVINTIKGMLLFTCALLRYTTRGSIKNLENAFITYKSISDWRSSHSHSSSSSEEPTGPSLEKI